MSEQDLLSSLADCAHSFPINGDAVEVLESPDQFFLSLLEGLSTAQRHITIASLYIGTEGGREEQFVRALAAAVHDASRPQLEVDILVDALRSTRPTKGASGSLTNTAEMLASALLSQPTPTTVRVALFHTPALRGLLRRLLPPRLREVVGVQHMKAYAFDDTVLLSGANLSNAYFSMRQDRYLLVRGTPQLAAFVREAVRTVSELSYQLLPAVAGEPRGGTERARGAGAAAARSGSEAANKAPLAPASPEAACRRGTSVGITGRTCSDQRLSSSAMQHTAAASSEGYAPPGVAVRGSRVWARAGSRLQHGQAYRLGPPPQGPDPVRHAWLFARKLRGDLLQLFVPPGGEAGVLDFGVLVGERSDDQETGSEAGWGPGWDNSSAGHAPGSGSSVENGSQGCAGQKHPRAGSSAPAAAGPGLGPGEHAAAGQAAETDTWVIPLAQAGFVGLRQEERCMLGVLGWAAQSSAAGAGAGLLHVSTPYFNLARPYEWRLAQSPALGLELLTSSPEANGFSGSRGMSGYIPQAYSLLEHRTWQRLTRLGQAAQQAAQQAQHCGALRTQPEWSHAAMQLGTVAQWPAAAQGKQGQQGQHGSRLLLEYARRGWEFHAKGFWFTPPGSSHPIMTAVGSSNFGFRSLHRDLEMQFVVVTHNSRLQQALGQEFEKLKQHAHAVGDSHFQQPGRRGGAVARMAVRLLRGFL